MTKSEYLSLRRDLTAQGFKVRKKEDLVAVAIGYNPTDERKKTAHAILHDHGVDLYDITLYNSGLMVFGVFITDYNAPRRLYVYDDATRTANERDYFIINGEFEDGTKVWTRCDKDGNYKDTCGYTVGRRHGKMIAHLEFVD